MIEPIFNLLTTPPGNLVYHLALTLSVFGALLSLRPQNRGLAAPTAGRLTTGLIIILAAQLGLFIVSALTWQELISPQQILPPLDIAITTFNLLWIAWMWAFPKRIALVEAGQVFTSLLIAFYLVYSLIFWVDQSGNLPFTQTWIAGGWELIGLIIVLLTGGLLVFRRPSLWGTGLVFMLIAASGYLVQFFTNLNTQDFSGPIRLALLAAYPLLLVLPQRVLDEGGAAQTKPKYAPHPITQERRRYSTDSKTLEAFLQLACQTSVPNLPGAVCRVISHAMLADLSFLVTCPEAGGIINLEGGFDLIREEMLPGATISPHRIPQIEAALQKGRPLYLYQENGPSTDMETLAVTLGLNQVGNLLLVPFFDGESHPVGGMLLLSPYANRIWSVDDQIFLQPVGRSLVRILQRLHGTANLQSELDRALIDLDAAQAAYQQLRQTYQELRDRHETLKATDQLRSSQQDNLESVIAVQQEYQGIIAHLQDENQKLQMSAGQAQVFDTTGQSADGAVLKQLESALQKVSVLQNALDEALNSPPPVSSPADPLVGSIAQELRQPLAAISGYTELLLGESIGILGALQRNFLERIRTASQKMDRLTQDLITSLDRQHGEIDFTPERVNLSEIIDAGVQTVMDTLTNKRINLETDLPQDLPALAVDPDSLYQIVCQLMKNAAAVTPPEGIIHLGARIQNPSGDEEYLLFQVTDTGAGIPADDLPRVFTNRIRDNSPAIPGIGINGTELEVAKALVVANHGRIWVDSQVDVSTTFSILLPVQTGPLAASLDEGVE